MAKKLLLLCVLLVLPIVYSETSYNCVSQGFFQSIFSNANFSMTGNLQVSGKVTGAQLCVPNSDSCISAWTDINGSSSNSSMDYTHVQNFTAGQTPCPSGQYVFGIMQNGTVNCSAPTAGSANTSFNQSLTDTLYYSILNPRLYLNTTGIDNATIVRSYNTTWKVDTLAELQSTVSNDFHNLGGTDKVNTTADIWALITNGTIWNWNINGTLWGMVINGTLPSKSYVNTSIEAIAFNGTLAPKSYCDLNIINNRTDLISLFSTNDTGLLNRINSLQNWSNDKANYYNKTETNNTIDAKLTGRTWIFVSNYTLYGTAQGDINLTQVYDSYSLNITEVASNGLEYYANTSNNATTDINLIGIRYRAIGENFQLSLRSGSTWESYGTLAQNTDWDWKYFSIRDISGHLIDNKINVKITHSGTANPSHQLKIDYLFVSSGYNVQASSEVDPHWMMDKPYYNNATEDYLNDTLTFPQNNTNANFKDLNVSQTLYVNSSCTITGNSTPCIIQTCGSSQIILCS